MYNGIVCMWISIEKVQKRRLNATALSTWEKLPAKTIGKVFKRWVKVLDLMIKGNGRNRFAEKHRGELTNDPTSSNPQCFLKISLFYVCWSEKIMFTIWELRSPHRTCSMNQESFLLFFLVLHRDKIFFVINGLWIIIALRVGTCIASIVTSVSLSMFLPFLQTFSCRKAWTVVIRLQTWIESARAQR